MPATGRARRAGRRPGRHSPAGSHGGTQHQSRFLDHRCPASVRDCDPHGRRHRRPHGRELVVRDLGESAITDPAGPQGIRWRTLVDSGRAGVSRSGPFRSALRPLHRQGPLRALASTSAGEASASRGLRSRVSPSCTVLFAMSLVLIVRCRVPGISSRSAATA